MENFQWVLQRSTHENGSLWIVLQCVWEESAGSQQPIQPMMDPSILQ